MPVGSDESGPGGIRIWSPTMVVPAVIIVLAAEIAAFAPGDAALQFAAAGLAPLRGSVVIALALAGLFFADRAGLSLLPRAALSQSLLAALGAAAAVALVIILLDTVLLQGKLPPDYKSFISATDTKTRLAYFMPRAFLEEVLYRLFLMSAFAYLIKFWRPGRDGAAQGWFVAATLAQTINVLVNAVWAAPAPLASAALAYDVVRYLLPGLVWGYLYWRHGLVVAQLAHAGTHVFVQPALTLFMG